MLRSRLGLVSESSRTKPTGLISEKFFGCLNVAGHRVLLGRGSVSPGDSGSEPAQFELVGDYVTFALEVGNRYEPTSVFSIDQYNLRSRAHTAHIVVSKSGPALAAVPLGVSGKFEFAASAHGTIAWVVGGTTCPPSDCSVFEVLVRSHGATKIVDSQNVPPPSQRGPGPPVGALAFHGTTLTWTSLGQPRSAQTD